MAESQNGFDLLMNSFNGFEDENLIKVALAGNPNVGKSTIFNALTGMNQHTGNWPGKTVAVASGTCTCGNRRMTLVDLPGTYSLLPHSAEEELTGEYLCFGNSDVVVAVCDATCLERNLNLVLQIMEVCPKVILCLNMQDEAERKGIKIDIPYLSQMLKIPVVLTTAGKGKGLDDLLNAICSLAVGCDGSCCKKCHGCSESCPANRKNYYEIDYGKDLENSIPAVKKHFPKSVKEKVNPKWLALRLLANEEYAINLMKKNLSSDFLLTSELQKTLIKERAKYQNIEDQVVKTLVEKSADISKRTVKNSKDCNNCRDRKIDKILTGKYTAFPIMILMLAFIFWLTIVGANYPSAMLSEFFAKLGEVLTEFMVFIGLPKLIISLLMDGIYLVVTWVVAVMLPPMAIFFPLFTLLEDLGYLPRIAFNLDKYFKKCSACGKQALTMAMGFGCNAAAIVGCRIIDSPRERLMAMLTNVFVPCNGRFPTMIAVISIFLVGSFSGFLSSVTSALILSLVIVFGIMLTLLVSWLLSKTLLKGVPSSFALELPPYRKPRIAKVIVRSVFDRTLFVLGRALVVAAPAGLIIWLMANLQIEGASLLQICANFLQPFGEFLGLDGVILLAFILGIPANEIVLPIMLMIYLSTGALVDVTDLNTMQEILIANGWDMVTAVCVILFYLVHWPCATTLLTIKKESGSIKWMFLAFVIPTIIGLLVCFSVSHLLKFIMLII